MIGWIIVLVVVVLAIGVGAMFCAPWSPLNKEHEEAKNLPIKAVDFTKLNDGTYIGDYAGGMYKWRTNEVQVTIASGKVQDIKLLSSANTNPKNATTYEPLYARVIGAQSLQVDAISGATLDSKAYLKAVEGALLKAEQK